MKMEKTNHITGITRRRFIAAASSLTASTVVPRRVLGSPGASSPSEKLNVACIGVGGRGYDNLRAVSTESIIARSMHPDDIAALLSSTHTNVSSDGGLALGSGQQIAWLECHVATRRAAAGRTAVIEAIVVGRVGVDPGHQGQPFVRR